MDNERGFTAIMVRPSTQEFVKERAADFGMPMYELVDKAVCEYVRRHALPDLRRVSAASDPISGDGEVRT